MGETQVREGCEALLPSEDLLVRSPIVARQRVLAIEVDSTRLCGPLDLTDEILGLALTLRRLLVVAHLQASKIEACMAVRGEDISDFPVRVALVCVVVSGRHFSCMALAAVPPVDARHLPRQSHLASEGCARSSQDIRAVVLQGTEVPVQEELAVFGLVAAVEEPGVPGPGIVGSRVIGRHRPAPALTKGAEVCKRMLIVCLELTDAAELPAVAHEVGRVPQLAAGAHAHLDLRDRAAQLPFESSSKRGHPIPIHVQGRAAAIQRHVISKNGYVFLVLVAMLVLEPHVAVMRDPGRQWDRAIVAHIAAALVEGSHELHLEAALLCHLHQLLVSVEVVHLGLALCEPPPHVHHEAVSVRLSELVQLPRNVAHVQHSVVRHGGEAQHHINFRVCWRWLQRARRRSSRPGRGAVVARRGGQAEGDEGHVLPAAVELQLPIAAHVEALVATAAGPTDGFCLALRGDRELERRVALRAVPDLDPRAPVVRAHLHVQALLGMRRPANGANSTHSVGEDLVLVIFRATPSLDAVPVAPPEPARDNVKALVPFGPF
mmetsp:Transcript_3395/g.9349  ORF Transcript_3395/g.9349 Transcript_3395/m.9349 type:complete len:548 (-) Transcript_3395:158-1801(-)